MKKILLALLILIIIGLIFQFNLHHYLTFEYLKQNLTDLKSYYHQDPIFFVIAFSIAYLITCTFAIPGASILTLASGAIFGLWKGFILVSFVSSIGATLALLASRYIFRDIVENKFGEKLRTINEGLEREGAFYLFTLRLAPIFPFFLINFTMGLTKIKISTFYWVSQIGMILGTLVYINAGVEISRLEGLSGILSPKMIFSMTMLGILPLVSKKIIEIIKAKKIYKKYKKPKKFDYDMIAIGAGAAGLVTSYISATVKAKVLLVEKHKMGGDCLNYGCIPSKAIIKSASLMKYVNEAQKFGFSKIAPEFSFENIMNRVHKVIKEVEPHDSKERYTSLGVDCLDGFAKIVSPWEVEVDGKIFTTRNITIATGASPFVPQLKGIDKARILTSENLWSLKELPKKMIVLGGGPIGVEMAQAFSRLGSSVTLVEMGERILPREDHDVSEIITKKLESEKVSILLKTKAVEIDHKKLIVENKNNKLEIEFDEILFAVGRRPNVQGIGIEDLGIVLKPNGTIDTNEYLQTNFPNIYACGDVTGPYQLTHISGHQAWYCAVNALFGFLKKFKVDYSAVPWSTYSDPQVATVGVNEIEARKKGIDFEVTKYEINDLDRAIADSLTEGFVKILTKKGTDQIIGATIVSHNAGDIISELTLALKYKIGMNKILSTIHPYPTHAEAIKYTAGLWKQNHKPNWVFPYLEKFFKWKRG
ncbi:MAG: bifunctional TVP38/TMEM64 family protein/FAD-dependent oxidoreductase [Bacteriovoracaceae bacterium]